MSRSRKDGVRGGSHKQLYRPKSRRLYSTKMDFPSCGCCEFPRVDGNDVARIGADDQLSEWQSATEVE